MARRKPRAGKFGNRRTNRRVGPGRPRSRTPGRFTPQTPGERSADQTVGPYWRNPGGVPVITDRPGGGGAGGGGGGQAAPVLGPPPGTYDPQLDASERASDRGLRDFIFDTQRAGTRALEDYGTSRWDAVINRTRGREDLGSAIKDAAQDYRIGKADIGQEYGRLGEDIGIERYRSQDDRNRAVSDLARQYGILGAQQGQGVQGAGAGAGGALAAAGEKRYENRLHDQEPIDTSLARTLADLDLSQKRGTENRDRAMLGLNTEAGRLGTDLSRQGTRMEQDYTRLLGTDASPRSGLLYQGYSRGVEDRGTGLLRANREHREFGQDLTGSRYYQARYGAGSLPIWRPRSGGPRKRDPYAPPRRRR